MGQDDKKRSDQGEERDAFHHKGQQIGPFKPNKDTYKKKQERAVYENPFHVICSDIAQDQVGHRSARQTVYITAYKKLSDEAGHEQNQAAEK